MQAGQPVRKRRTRRVLVLAAGLLFTLQAFLGASPVGPARVPDAAAEVQAPPAFLSKVFAAAAQGATAAVVAALLSAVTEPIVNRLLVKRMTFVQAISEITFASISKFFATTLFTNMLKFPVFEVINMVLSFSSLSGWARGTVTGWLFCTIMLPITNYRFHKSMGWQIRPNIFYQAYVPTVARDIAYGVARGVVGGAIQKRFAPETPFLQALAFGATVWGACIISSPGNEWRGYTLQPKEARKSFVEYFKPVSYARSTGIGACIMGISLMMGRLVTPYAELLFAYCKERFGPSAILLIFVLLLAPVLKRKASQS